MKNKTILLLGAALLAVPFGAAQAGERYSTPPAVTLSPDLASPWILQLKRPAQKTQKARVGQSTTQQRVVRKVKKRKAFSVSKQKPAQKRVVRATGIFAGLNTAPARTPKTIYRKKKKLAYNRVPTTTRAVQSPAQRPIDPRFLPQMVSYQTKQKPGTVIVDTNTRFLYLVMGNGKARRYGVGVGKQGFEWSGTEKVTRKAEWPSWTPPKEMIIRERKKGRELPSFMPGGPANPMGARAIYLGSTLYRIHGTNQPWTIGQAVSSGCIRMRNEDVMDLYERVRRGAKVIVS
jgi:lipoprotein-anchoring transpeptidase ErfK/SrfK